MEILAAYDLTRCAHSAAQLAGCDSKTVRRYVAVREAGGNPCEVAPRPKKIDPFLEKIEEKVDQSKGKVRADVVHADLIRMGYRGSERSTRRAVAAAKTAWRSGRRRTYRPWVPEPGMWLQFDWGQGPRIGGRKTYLFCAWLAWSRFRVVIPVWDLSVAGLVACLDQVLRVVGGAPTYLLSDNAKTVTVDHVAGVAVRNPDMVALGRHYGCVVHSCVPYDPESKGGAEATVKIAKADLVPTQANLGAGYGSFAELEQACRAWCTQVNGRVHRETRQVPIDLLAIEAERLHALPAEPYVLALGEERLVNDDQTVRFGGVRYSTPPGHVGSRVWCRVHGGELVVIARTRAGLAEICRHDLSTPGNPRIADEHYPDHPGGNTPKAPRPKARTAAEQEFLAIGDGAHAWLIEAGANGVSRIRTKMAAAVELAAALERELVDQALALAAIHTRFAEDDLASICDHLAREGTPGLFTIADETHSAQPGTIGWAALGATGAAGDAR